LGVFINVTILRYVVLGPCRKRQFGSHICVLTQRMNSVSRSVPCRRCPVPQACKGTTENSGMRGQPPSTLCTKDHNQACWNLDSFGPEHRNLQALHSPRLRESHTSDLRLFARGGGWFRSLLLKLSGPG